MIPLITLWETLKAISINEFRSLRRNQNIIVYFLIYLTVFFVAIGLFGRWRQRAIPTALPYVVMRLLNVFQLFFAIVIAGQSWSDDIHCDTIAAIHSRSFTNLIYILGKTFAITAFFAIWNIVLMVFVIIVDLLLLDDVSVPFSVYGLYLLVIPFPTVIAATGFTYIAMRFIKNLGVVVTVFCGLFVLLYVIANPGNGFITDPTGYMLPLLYSDFVGFGNGQVILLQRGLYVLLGLGFLSLSVALFNRLRQSVVATIVVLLFSVLCFYASYRSGSEYLSSFAEGRVLRQTINTLNKLHADDSRVLVTDCALTLFHKGNNIEVTAHLTIANTSEKPLDSYLFSLNPGLDVSSITDKELSNIAFSRERHLLTIIPQTVLLPGESDSLVILYKGTIDENACYPDLDESERYRPNEYFRFVVDKRYTFLSPEFVLLTSEALWYPVPGVYGASIMGDMSHRQFTHYTLTVTTSPELMAISQGAINELSETVYQFFPETPLTQISLVIGKYEQRHIKVDGIPLTVFLKPGHDFFSQYFEKVDKSDLETYLGERKREFEGMLGATYPFKRFTIVEVPASFLAYPRFRPYAPATIQPEQVFLPEKTAFLSTEFERMGAGPAMNLGSSSLLDAAMFFFQEFFEITFERETYRKRKEIMRDGGLTWEKIRWNTYYHSTMYDFNIFPNYYWFSNAIYADSADPMNQIDLLIGSYMRGEISHMNDALERHPRNIATSALRYTSFRDFLGNPDNYDIGHEVIETEAQEFVWMCMAVAGIDENEFKDFLLAFLSRNRFRQTDANLFADEFMDTFGVDIRERYTHLITDNRLPKYEINDVAVEQYEIGNSMVYNYVATIYNVGNVSGVLRAYTYDWEHGRHEVHVFLESGQAKKIGFVSDISFNSNHLFFEPILSQHDWQISVEAENDPDIVHGTPFEGIAIVPVPPTLRDRGHIEVDNLDEGFSVLSSPPEKNIQTIINAFISNHDMRKPLYSAYQVLNPPDSWTLTRRYGFSGFEMAVHYIKAGVGDQRVQWETDIARPGIYEVEYFIPAKASVTSADPRKESILVKDLHFTINHADGVSERIIDIASSDPGWVSLGIYNFNEGPACVVLSNKSKGKFVYADAVRWDIQE